MSNWEKTVFVLWLITTIATPIMLSGYMYNDDHKSWENKKEKHFNKYYTNYELCKSLDTETKQISCMEYYKYPVYALYNENAFDDFVDGRWVDKSTSEPTLPIYVFMSVILGAVVSAFFWLFIFHALTFITRNINEWYSKRPKKEKKPSDKWQNAIESELENLEKRIEDLEDRRNVLSYDD